MQLRVARSPTRQRACACEGPRQAPCPACRAAGTPLRRAAVAGGGVDLAAAAVPAVVQRGGVSLDASTRATLGAHFAHDFAEVRIHADAVAARSAAALAARAYTVGRHIVFGAGEYAPATAAGRALLAHEATHALQQGLAPWTPATLSVADPADPSEREADRHAAQMVRGGVVERAPVRVARAPCVTGTACGSTIAGANDSTATGTSKLATDEAELVKKGQSTWEFSQHFRRFAETFAPAAAREPTAWLVRQASPWPAFAAKCPPDLVARDSTAKPQATGQRGPGGNPDHCVFVSPEQEKNAETFLTQPKATTIGGVDRADWEHKAQLITVHELAHVPVRREVQAGLAAGSYSTQAEVDAIAGPLNEAAGVLAEMPLIAEHALQGSKDAAAAINAKVNGPSPPGSGYTMAGLLERACCTVSCSTVRDRVVFLTDRAATRWSTKQYSIIAAALENASFCGGKVKLAIPAQARNAPSRPPHGPPP